MTDTAAGTREWAEWRERTAAGTREWAEWRAGGCWYERVG